MALPFTVIVDRDGKVAYAQMGPLKPGNLDSYRRQTALKRRRVDWPKLSAHDRSVVFARLSLDNLPSSPANSAHSKIVDRLRAKPMKLPANDTNCFAPHTPRRDLGG